MWKRNPTLASVGALVNGAIDAFVRAAAIELPRGLRVNSISPNVLVEAMPGYAPYFRGFKPVPGAEVALAYAKSVEGLQVLEKTAPFFQRRFTTMRWSILTPDGCAFWDGERLSFGPPATRAMAPGEDEVEEFWKTYYASTFNPARLKMKTMQGEMAGGFAGNGTALVNHKHSIDLSGTRSFSATERKEGASSITGSLVAQDSSGATLSTLTVKQGSAQESPVSRDADGNEVAPGSATAVSGSSAM